MRRWEWCLAFILSLIIHGVIGGFYWEKNSPEQIGARGLGDGGIEVGLGMQGSYAERQSIADTLEKSRDIPETEPKKEAQEAEEILIEKAETLEIEKKTIVEIPNEVVDSPQELSPQIDAVATIHPTPNTIFVDKKQNPRPSIQEKKAVDKKSVQKTITNRSDDTQHGTANLATKSTYATGIENNRPVGGKVGNAQTYLGHLMTWLNNYKQYPVEAKKLKQQGTVKLQFTIDRQGQILDYKIKESSGSAVLDVAAIEMLKAAAPLPAMPDDFYPNRKRMLLVIPVEYSLITNRSL